MKKILVAAIVFATTSAFAQSHMVRVYGGDLTDGSARSVDFSKYSDDADDKTDTMNIALNYAYTVAPQIQVGGTFKRYSGESSGADVGTQTIGLSGYYNLSDKLNDTCYFAFHYNMMSASEGSGATTAADYAAGKLAKDDKRTDMVLEYGHRFNLGSAWGLNLTYAPNLAYTMSTITVDALDEDAKSTTLAWNFLKFDVLF